MGSDVKTQAWLDKSEWGDGPWQEEPDRVEWHDPATGFVCLITRHPSFGTLCGYIGLPPEHPWHGRLLGLGEVDVVAHGGITYIGPCMDDDRPLRERVCHHPELGETDNIWWLGFDCCHGWDVMPGVKAMGLGLFDSGGTYKTVDFVRHCCTEMAAVAQAVLTCD